MDACFETWIDAMAKWYHVQLVANLVMIRIDGTGKPVLPEGVQPGLERIVLDGCPIFVGAALRKLERPVTPEVVEVVADRAMALRLTQEVQARIGRPTLAVCRLVVAKPYAPCRLWWAGGNGHSNTGLIMMFATHGGTETRMQVLLGSVEQVSRRIATDFAGFAADEIAEQAAKPIADWIRARPDGPWSLTADEVGKLLEHKE